MEKRSLGRLCVDCCLTVFCAGIGGMLGQWAGVPAGAMVFSLLSVAILKLVFDRGYLPGSMRRAALLINGCYIGSTIFLEDILVMHTLMLPGVILLVSYTVVSLLMAWGIAKRFGFCLQEAMLMTTPAGATDMILIAEDLGLRSVDVGVIQVFRVITVVAIFPQIIWLILQYAS